MNIVCMDTPAFFKDICKSGYLKSLFPLITARESKFEKL